VRQAEEISLPASRRATAKPQPTIWSKLMLTHKLPWTTFLLLALGALAQGPLYALQPASDDKPDATAKSAKPRSRTFLFTYGATVSGLMPGQTARIWLPV